MIMRRIMAEVKKKKMPILCVYNSRIHRGYEEAYIKTGYF
jgi:hypothetical protein